MRGSFISLTRWLILSVLLLSAVAAAEEPAPAVKDAFTPLPAGSVKMGGYVGSKLDLCIQNRVAVQKIDPLVEPLRDEKPAGDEDRRGEYWGQWANSMAMACGYQPTPEHRTILGKAVEAVLAAAQDGYIGARPADQRLAGWDAWDASVTVSALLACRQHEGGKAALEAAAKCVDAVLARLERDKADVVGVSPARLKGLAGGSLLRPAVLLYRRTGEKKYLDLANATVESWSKPSKLAPGGLQLVEDALAGKPAARMASPFAREQLACFVGLIELYRASGQAKYLQAAVKLAETVLAEEATIIGPGSSGGMWCGGARKQTVALDQPMDTRVTAEWMKFVYELLLVTGESRWADELEKTLLNGLLGAMMADGDWWAAYTPLMGERVPSDIPYHGVGVSGAVLAGPGALLLTPAWAVTAAEGGFAINLYFEGSVDLTTPKGKPLRLVMETRYPQASAVLIKVQLAEPEEFTLAFRIPAWSAQTAVSVKGQAVEAKAGEYVKVPRLWAENDRVELTLDMRARIVDAPDANGFAAVLRGPLVLALDSRLVPAAESIRVRASLDRSKGPVMPLMLDPEVPRRFGVLVGVETPFNVDAQAKMFFLCDYASAGKSFSERNLFRTYLPPALNMGKAYDTGVTWQKLTINPTTVRPRAPGK